MSGRKPKEKLPVDLPGERWLAAVGHAGYEVSDLGRLRTTVRRNGMAGAGPLRIVEGHVRKKSGYVFVALRNADGSRADRQMHRLVLEAFVGPCPPGMETRHGNGVRHDNRLGNICWGTRQENAADKDRHGTHLRGQRSPNAKLTDGMVRLMREWRAAGVTYRKLAARFGVSEPAVAHVCKGKTYRSD